MLGALQTLAQSRFFGGRPDREVAGVHNGHMAMVSLVVLLAAGTFANATVVSTDATHRTLTIKGDQGRNEVLEVDGAAVAGLQGLKPGDEVILTLRGAEGQPRVVTVIERSVRRAQPAAKKKPRAARPARPAMPVSPAKTPPTAPTPKVSPVPGSARPPTDTVGPLQDPRRGAQQDPRDNPNRDPRVVPGLTVPPPNVSSPAPSPTPTPSPAP